MLTPQLEEFIRRMPKVELHLHLEGAVSPRTLLELAERNRIDIAARSVSDVERLLDFRDFSEFLNVFMNLTRTIVSGEDFERIAYELGHDLAAQQVRYAEVMISPMQHINRGLDLREAISGAASGFARAEQETGTVVRLALDYGRQYGPESAWPVLEIAREMMGQGVVGWSIGGNEIGFPPEPYAPLFAAAREAGLGLMAHAGEVVGPESVWGAIEALGATRLGHGIRSVSDPRLLAEIRHRGIALDVCPSSNVRTGAAASWTQHPIRSLVDADLLVTLNSDDPTFFSTTLTEEFRRATQIHHFTVDDLCALVRNGARAAFLPAAERAALESRLASELQQLRTEIGI